MARIWSSGFELMTGTDHIEWQTNQGAPAISTTTKRGGAAALRCNAAGSAVAMGVQAYDVSTGSEHVFLRGYFYVASAPSATTTIMGWADNTAGVTGFYGVRMNSSRQLYIGGSSAASGTLSSALALNTWYRVEIDYDDGADTLKGYLDGVNWSGTLTGQDLAGGAFARWGVMQNVTADIYVDDIAINDSTGSVQNGLPGEGYIVHMRPNAAGDNNGFATAVGGTAGAANNFTRVNEITPNGSTSYNQTTATGTTTIDDFNVDSLATAGIGSTDTVKFVQVGAYVGSNAATAANLVYRVKSQSGGTVLESGSISCATNGWTTHDNTLWKYQLTSYTDPQSGGAWTPAKLETMQIGYRGNVSQTTQRRVSTLWALVEFTRNFTETDDDSVGVTDAAVSQLTRAQSPTDSVGVTDAQAFARGLNPADSVGVTDIRSVVLSNTKADTVNVTDDFATQLTGPGPTFELIHDNFEDGTIDPAMWPDTYGGCTETGGRARVPCTTGYAAYATNSAYKLGGSFVYAQVFPAADGGATAECWTQLLIQTPTPGTDIVMEQQSVQNLVKMSTRVGYVDAGSVEIAYDPTEHAWFRIRESAGTLYWDTSPDGLAWTNRRSVASPAWVNDSNLNLQLISHRADGTANYAEFDNVNTGGGNSWAEPAADDIDVSDSVTILYTGDRSESDTVDLTDEAIVGLGVSEEYEDTVGLTDAAAPERGYGRPIVDSTGLTDSISRVYNGIRTPVDNVGVTDPKSIKQDKVREDLVGLTDSFNASKSTLPVVPPSSRPLIGLTVKLFDPAPGAFGAGPMGAGGDIVSVVPDIRAISWTDEMSQDGTVTLEYPIDGVNAALLMADRAEGAVFWGDMEIPGTRFLVAEQARDPLDEQGGIVKINAPTFVGKRLTEAIVHPPNWPVKTPSKQTFSSATGGEVMLTLIEQAQSRGALGNLEVDFDGVVDSAGNPWLNVVNFEVNIGETYRSVLNKLLAMGVVDWRGDGRTLQLYNWTFMGTDRSVGATPVMLLEGRDLVDSPENRSVLNIANTILSVGEEGTAVEVGDAGSVAEFGRIEGFVSSSGVTDTGTLTVIADIQAELSSHAKQEFTHTLTWADERSPVPYRDYRVGDKVLRVVGGDKTGYVIRQLTFDMDQNGDVKATITLNDKLYTWDIELARWVDTLGGGSGSSASAPADPDKDRVPPNAPTSVLVTSNAYTANGGITYAAVQATWTEPTQNTDGSTMTDLDHYEVQWKYDTDVNWVGGVSTGGNVVEWSGVAPGRNISVRVQAVDRNGNRSAWSAPGGALTDSDSTGPDKPSTPEVSNYLGVLRVVWDGLSDVGASQPADFAGTEVHISAINGFTPDATTKVDTLPAAGVSIISSLGDGTPLTYGVTYYVKLRSFDRSGNYSPVSDQGSGSTSQVVQTDIGTGQVGLSNLSFSDVGNLIDDGSFELDNWRDQRLPLPSGWTFATDQASNGSYSLKVVASSASNTYTLRTGILVRPGEVYVGTWDYRMLGAVTGAFLLYARFRDAAGVQVGGSISLCRVTDDASYGTWHMRNSDLEATVPAGASTMDLVLFQSAMTGTVWVDAVEARQRMDSVLIANAAITNAKIANLAVNNAKISDLSVAKVTAGTISADWILGARIKTADTGARVELNSGGIGAWNSGGTQTVSIASSTGDVSIIGQLKSGTSGKRLEINPTNTLLPEIRFYPTSGANYGFINAFAPAADVYLGMNTGQFTAPGSVTASHRLYMTNSASGILLHTIRSSDQEQHGPALQMDENGVTITNQRVTDPVYLGYVSASRTAAGIGVNSNSTSLDSWIEFDNTRFITMIGAFRDYISAANNQAIWTGTVDGTSGASSYATTYGATMLSQLIPHVSIRDNVTHAYAITDSSTTGFEVSISPAASGAWAVYIWCWRL